MRSFRLSALAVLSASLLVGLMIGCGGETEVIVEKEVIKEVEVEKIVKEEVIKEVEVVKEVEVEKIVVATPVPAPIRIPELILTQTGNPVCLGADCASSVDEMDIFTQFTEPLMLLDPDNNLIPWLAESLVMHSPTDWTMTLRQGVKFHEPEYGTMTAKDVIASYYHDVREGTANKKRVPVSMQEAVLTATDGDDGYVIDWKLSGDGTASLPNHLAAMRTVVTAKGYIDVVGEQTSRHPMGTGPFVFQQWQPNVKITGSRFDDYWRGAPPIQKVVWKIIPDAFTRKQELMTGGAHILRALEPDSFDEVNNNDGTRAISVLSSRYVYVVLDVDEAPFDNQKFRQALNYAVNKQEIVDTLFGGFGAAAVNGVTHPFLCENDGGPPVYQYDLEKAKSLIDEARAEGAPVDDVIKLYAPNDRYVLDKETGEAVLGYWKAAGLNVEYYPQSRSVLFPLALRSFTEYKADIDGPFLIGNGNGLGRAEFPYELWLENKDGGRGRAFASPHPASWEEDLAAARLLASCSDESKALLAKMNKDVVDFAPWVFLVNFNDLYGGSDEIEWRPWATEIRMLYEVDLR